MENNQNFSNEVQERLANFSELTDGQKRKLGIFPNGRPAYLCPASYIHDGKQSGSTYEYNIGRDC